MLLAQGSLSAVPGEGLFYVLLAGYLAGMLVGMLVATILRMFGGTVEATSEIFTGGDG